MIYIPSEVKWIKIVTDIFDDEKIQLIEAMPDADGIIVIWFKLLCLAGKTNHMGILMLNDRIPYNEEMLSQIFRRPLNTIRLALATFEQYGMIEIINGTITIPNWDKHQSLDKLEHAREQSRQRSLAYRERQKQLLSGEGPAETEPSQSADPVTRHVTHHAPVTQRHAAEEEKEGEIDTESEKETEKEEEIKIPPTTTTSVSPEGAPLVVVVGEGSSSSQGAEDRNEVLRAAATAGFPKTKATREKLEELLSLYGRDLMLKGINACVDQSKPFLSYLKGCLAIMSGEKKREKKTDNPYLKMLIEEGYETE